GSSRSSDRFDSDCASSTQASRNPSSDLSESAVWSCMPSKIITPVPPFRRISAVRMSNRWATPRLRIFDSISAFALNLSERCTSRMQTKRSDGSQTIASTACSARKCDFPDARPPFAPLYRDGCMKGSAHRGTPLSISIAVATVDDAVCYLHLHWPACGAGVLHLVGEHAEVSRQ